MQYGASHTLLDDLRECPDCGLFVRLPAPVAGSDQVCPRCDFRFRRVRHAALQKTLLWSLVAMIFYLLLATSPMLDLDLRGHHQTSTLATGPLALEGQQLWLLGAVVVFGTLVMPFVKIALMLIVLLGLRREHPPVWLVDCLRWSRQVSHWAMLEVYLLGILVAYTRLAAMGQVRIDVAVYALIGAVVAMAAMDTMFDEEAAWEKLRRKGFTEPVDTGNSPLIGCHHCHQASRLEEGEHCPRCESTLHRRKPGSVSRTWAFVISAMIFYVPANAFPVMIITKLGRRVPHTIIGGMVEFWQKGFWPLALLIFIASIAIPMLKLLALLWMLLATRARSAHRLLDRTRLYRVIDFIGRWSMVDIFMAAILVGLVQFGSLAEIAGGFGGICFAAVVILTMIAVEQFDPRAMWDVADEEAPTGKSVVI